MIIIKYFGHFIEPSDSKKALPLIQKWLRSMGWPPGVTEKDGNRWKLKSSMKSLTDAKSVAILNALADLVGEQVELAEDPALGPQVCEHCGQVLRKKGQGL